jgi:putative endonuclease
MPQYAYVYILRCADGTLYTGYTVDLNRRVRQHLTGNGGKYTRSRVPVELVYSKRFKSRRQAMQAEATLKLLPRRKKLLLVGKGNASSTNDAYHRSLKRKHAP